MGPTDLSSTCEASRADRGRRVDARWSSAYEDPGSRNHRQVTWSTHLASPGVSAPWKALGPVPLGCCEYSRCLQEGLTVRGNCGGGVSRPRTWVEEKLLTLRHREPRASGWQARGRRAGPQGLLSWTLQGGARDPRLLRLSMLSPWVCRRLRSVSVRASVWRLSSASLEPQSFLGV